MTDQPITKVGYAPRKVFLPYHNRTQRFAVMVAHRRCGKTVSVVNDLIKRAATHRLPYGKFAYIAPLLSQGKDIAWEYLQRFARPLITDTNIQELRVTLTNGAQIRIHGADNPDRLRGGYLDHAALDEFGDMRPSVWGSAVRPMLADRLGGATFIGTPKGRNEFHQIYARAAGDPEWFVGRYRASETGILLPSELDAARRDMTEEEYEQEFECSFDAAIKGAYFGKEVAEAERAGRICQVAVVPDVRIQAAWDLGMHDATAIWVFQVIGGQIRILDYIEGNQKKLGYYTGLLDAKGWTDRIDWLPHDVKVQEMGTGKTRIEVMINELGCKVELIPDFGLMDGVNAARQAFERCWFEIRTTGDGLEALRQYRTAFDERTKAFAKTPRHDWTSHAADAFRYLCIAWRVMSGKAVPAKVKPIGVSMDELTHDDFMDISDSHRDRGRV